MTEQDRGRQLRRRHMHERQAVIFGVLLAILALAGLGAAAMFTGSLNVPLLAREFATESTPEATQDPYPCPPAGALPVAYGQISVKVYNATSRVGLAGDTAADLSERGFVIVTKENAPATYDGTARITFGTQGVAQAYTLAAHIDGAVLKLASRADATVDLELGSEFAEINPADAVTLDPAAPLIAPEGCTPFDEVVAPAETPAPAAG
ncbi:LytR C-terminal domain-containing protein [Cellulomonas fengjieae]|uniref:LytR C-terminal domain-containing protein n=1 Tax=Cellulomonas fengjieae TaxID=2819978 RepID=A0ABS3SBG0_9CELL|nr:LytR C-terminal domain-containing protein [Cellulomonas fengjieae]MBO3083092.1 LytR C-terminal domain-containing protein [Cellulomonas fengjieae]MBO3102161.1 LytR C-terminal domain-containing protein [Cellulomonas fengjieae]QVI65542.1 LytR C-terminal domain-containing protein [Cellulomonas fengjieae]